MEGKEQKRTETDLPLKIIILYIYIKEQGLLLLGIVQLWDLSALLEKKYDMRGPFLWKTKGNHLKSCQILFHSSSDKDSKGDGRMKGSKRRKAEIRKRNQTFISFGTKQEQNTWGHMPRSSSVAQDFDSFWNFKPCLQNYLGLSYWPSRGKTSSTIVKK